MRRGSRRVGAAAAGLGVALLLLASAAADDRLIIAQPGYPGSTRDAAAFIERLRAAIAERGGPKIAAGEYHNDTKAALEAIRERKPTLGIVSLGFFLEHRKKLALEPLLWTQPDEKYHVVAAKGAFASLAELEGKSVTGTPLVEAEFIGRVVFHDVERGAPSSWKSEPAKYFSRAIRNVVKGRKEAVVLSEREYAGMKKLRSAEKLESIHATPGFPTAVAVAFGAADTADAKAGRVGFAMAVRALARRAKDAPDEEDVLETMGIDGFAAIDAARLASLISSYESGSNYESGSKPESGSGK